MFCILYAAVIVIFGLAIFLLPKNRILVRENRVRADFPALSVESLLDKSFFKGFSDFCSDSFPLRERLLALNSSLELGFGKLESNGVMKGKNQNLIKRHEYNDFERLKSNVDAVSGLLDYADKKGAETVFFCAPGTIDVLSEYCPLPFELSDRRAVWRYADGAVNINAMLRKKAGEGEYVCYKTDHHWTSLGAYYAYCEIGKELGYTPYPISDFRIETVSDDFLGTTYSSVLFFGTSPDKIEAFRYDGDTDITVSDPSTGESLVLYDDSALEGGSKYNFFLGGNRGRLKIESGKPKLVIIKDSFANSLIPLLARHYDVEAIDPRYLRKPVEEILEEIYIRGERPAMLILFGIDTLTGNVGL